MLLSQKSTKAVTRSKKKKTNIKRAVIALSLAAKKNIVNVSRMGLNVVIFVNASIVKMEMKNARVLNIRRLSNP